VETNRAQQQKNGAFDVVRAEKLSWRHAAVVVQDT
jgi:hypothetical protein